MTVEEGIITGPRRPEHRRGRPRAVISHAQRREAALSESTAPPTGPDALAGLPGWIIARATATTDLFGLIESLVEALVASGMPLLRFSISAPTIDPANRGLTLAWWRGRGLAGLLTAHGNEGEAEYRASPIFALLETGAESGRWDLAAGEGCDRFPLFETLRAEGASEHRMRMVAFAPGIAIPGVAIATTTDRAGGFTEAEVATIEALVPALGLALYRFSVSRTLTHLLGAYIGPQTAARVLDGGVRRGQGELISAAILLVDLKSFTHLADHEDPLKVVGWLDQHLEALGSGVAPAGGEILKFTGDGFIAVFPIAEREARPCRTCGHALDAVRAGLAANRALQAPRRAADEPWLAADLVLHHGEVVYGNIGTADRLDFTAIGRAVNEASRIEALCDALGRNVLISDSFAERCGLALIDLGEHVLRGVGAPRRLWTIAEA